MLECPFCGCELPLNVEICPDCGCEVDRFFLAEQVLESRVRKRTFDIPRKTDNYLKPGGNGARRKGIKKRLDLFSHARRKRSTDAPGKVFKSSPGWK